MATKILLAILLFVLVFFAMIGVVMTAMILFAIHDEIEQQDLKKLNKTSE